MTVSITWSTSPGADAITENVDEGNFHHGQYSDENRYYIRHDGNNPITNCKLYLKAVDEADYEGDFSPGEDVLEVLSWGDSDDTDGFGGMTAGFVKNIYGSEVFDSVDLTAWDVAFKCSVITSSEVTITGSQAYVISEDNTLDSHYLVSKSFPGETFPGYGFYEFSAYIKPVTRSYAIMTLIGAQGQFGWVVDLASNSFENIFGSGWDQYTESSVQYVSNGWYFLRSRFEINEENFDYFFLFGLSSGPAEADATYQGLSQESFIVSDVTIKPYVNDARFWPTLPAYGNEVLSDTDLTELPPWGRFNCTVATSPVSTFTGSQAYLISEDGDNGAHYIVDLLGVTLPSYGFYEFSMYFKAAARAYALAGFSGDLGGISQVMDLHEESINTALLAYGGYYDSSISHVGNGWYRYYVRFEIDSGGLDYFFFLGASSGPEQADGNYQGLSQESILVSDVSVKRYTGGKEDPDSNYVIFRTGVGDNTGNGVTLPTMIGLTNEGEIPAGFDNDVALQVRFQIPNNQYALGTRHVDLGLDYDYTD